jgi:hypothetical protein
MKTYHVNTRERDFSSRSARDVAEVAHAWKRLGLDPGVYVVFSGEKISCEKVEITSSTKGTARALASAEPEEGEGTLRIIV